MVSLRKTVRSSTGRHSWIVVVALLVASPGWTDTTGQLQGTVIGPTGAPLPRVSVTATSPAQIGGDQLARTDEEGRFRYPMLAPGSYVVRFEIDGHAPRELTGVQVRVDRTARLDVTMEAVTVSDEIEVTETTPSATEPSFSRVMLMPPGKV